MHFGIGRLSRPRRWSVSVGRRCRSVSATSWNDISSAYRSAVSGPFNTGLADDAAWLGAAELLTRKAAWAVDEAEPDAEALVSQGFVFASEGAQRTAGDSLHYHGGYGFMLEYDIQLYYRRAKAWSVIWDDPRREPARVADALYGAVKGA